MCSLKAKALIIIALLVLTISAFSVAALGDAQEKTEPANNIAVTAEPQAQAADASAQTMKIDSFAIGVI